MVDHTSQPVSPADEQVTNTTPARPETSAALGDDALLLDELAALWAPHRRRGLEIRHRTGQILNGQYDPKTRQERGSGLLKAAAERLGVAVSELSRMRNFADLFSSPDEFVQKYGEQNWTQVKALLPKLKAAKEAPERKKLRKADVKRASVRLCDRVAHLAKQLRRIDVGKLPEEQLAALRVNLQGLTDVLQNRLAATTLSR